MFKVYRTLWNRKKSTTKMWIFIISVWKLECLNELLLIYLFRPPLDINELILIIWRAQKTRIFHEFWIIIYKTVLQKFTIFGLLCTHLIKLLKTRVTLRNRCFWEERLHIFSLFAIKTSKITRYRRYRLPCTYSTGDFALPKVFECTYAVHGSCSRHHSFTAVRPTTNTETVSKI